MILYDPQTREEWLKCRCRGIGGSDAGAVIGVNKYKTNVDLWAEKHTRNRVTKSRTIVL
jgi:Phage-related protein, predicted endonuclease